MLVGMSDVSITSTWSYS